MLTHARLLEILAYDPTTGQFTWRVSPRKNTPAGAAAGSLKPNGYVRIVFEGSRHYAHRLAWFYVHGTWPSELMDHINRDRADNRISNLRPATDTQNMANMKKPAHNTSGFKGVVWNKQMSLWAAQIQCDGHGHFLGFHETPESAHATYLQAAKERFGEFARSE